ncbi:MAG TPA: hypothetical protein ENG66_05610 [Thermococcus sp.]|nr:hypothetical protein [Thermococcus sp.]
MEVIEIPNVFNILLGGSKKKFRCKKVEKEGITLVTCSPVEKKGEILEALGEGEVVFKIDPNTRVAELIDDGGVDRQTIKELDEYIKYFL